MGKDPTKPRGKMSSYAYFVQTCREEHKKKHPEATVNFSEFSKKCSERWKVSSKFIYLINFIHTALIPIFLFFRTMMFNFFSSSDHVCQGKREVWRYGQTWQGTLREGDEELHSTQRREEEEVQGPQCSQETPVSTFVWIHFVMHVMNKLASKNGHNNFSPLFR